MTSVNIHANNQQLNQYRCQVSHLNSAAPKATQKRSVITVASPATMAQHTKHSALHSQSPLAQAALQSMLSLCQWDVMNLNEQDYSEHF
ncbi:hypothetical protein [Agarivorans sp. 1_MG-2023]|uniref:hypothetical protein n=1 Tax=Agarivorans sp. 1_MG-2023 TaxID=3062634 RepID=UPI0026E27A27|nr:hypothetical protein [Agarivorans sp. 1_MG-2023]MDO6765161.1 hypothetical protein [Agarivorans sp. 1_MG-2023]